MAAARVASLNRVKDHPTLFRALRLLVERGLDVHLDIVGEDTMDGSAQALAQALGLDSRVAFHGFQPTDRLAAFYARAHLHYVDDWHPDRALAVPVQDPAALANAIGEMLQDPLRREQLASAAREWTLAHDADWTAAQFERIYGEALVGRM